MLLLMTNEERENSIQEKVNPQIADYTTMKAEQRRDQCRVG
ncbi:MAG: hypothetical protein JWM21_427 [Acidobacteria bacterium]|nr:hypothetical protein [Acidobacteriota bacterium]